MTGGVRLAIAADEIQAGLLRHTKGDWGDVCDEDRLSNDEALVREFRLFSVFQTSDETKFWIITEADRSCTMILLPEEY